MTKGRLSRYAHAGAKVMPALIAKSFKESVQQANRFGRRGHKFWQMLLNRSGSLLSLMVRGKCQGLRTKLLLLSDGQAQINAPAFVNTLGHTIPVAVLDLFFSNASAMNQLISVFISSKGASVIQVDMPGDIRVFRKAADHSRNLTGAFLDWMSRLHRLGFSLAGKFSPCDFGISHSGFLKGTRDLVDMLVPREDQVVKDNMLAIGDLIEDGIFNKAVAPLPPDIVDLIGILRKFNTDLYPLIHIHISRENGTKKSIIFTKMFDRLEVTKANDPPKYATILNGIPLSNWIHAAMRNVHLHQMLRVSQCSKVFSERICYFLRRQVRYGPTVEGLLKFRRDCEAHLLKDYSVDTFGGLEEALKAAHAVAMDREQSIAMAVKGTSSIPAPSATELQSPFNQNDASSIAKSIVSAVQRHQGSSAIATATATAAAIRRANHPYINTVRAERAAIIAANLAAQQLQKQLNNAPAGVSGAPVGRRQMFDEENVANMLDLVDPDMLHKLQRALFDAGELSTLRIHDDSTTVCLLS